MSSSTDSNNSDNDSNFSTSELEYESDENCMYGNEPEYTREELLELGEISDEDESDDSDADSSLLDNSRLENLHWCSCGNCDVMETLMECRCCKESRDLLGEKLDLNSCITENSHFKDVCLQPHVLEAAYMQNRRHNKRYSNINTVSNR